ncbi:alpha/beta-hydrolase [Stipitochalara longipes BDJ]|nr:alpha/beta-hydrolase [Stipitochalara longipes BDJ]
MSSSIFTSGTTSNEGSTLHFTTILPAAGETGKPPLILVPGGAGHGSQFLDIMPYFTSKFQPATFSRRQHGLSTPLPGTSFGYLNPAQQARDILAVADALGFGNQKLYLFSSSGGGVISFQLAAMHPKRVAHLIAHEMPCAALLPDSEKLLDFIIAVHATYLSDGAAAAYELFLPRFPGYEDVPRLGGAAEGDEERFLKYELLPLSLYTPDLRRVKESGVSVAFTYGKLSRDASYVRSTIELASVLGCQRYLVPGNHTGFRYEPEAFATEILKNFADMEEKERMRSVQVGF